jgi:hypothetical protein
MADETSKGRARSKKAAALFAPRPQLVYYEDLTNQ